jgi:hypothetical protein
MALPAGFPPRAPSGVRSIRFYATGTCGPTFDTNAIFFTATAGATATQPLPVVKSAATVAGTTGQAQNPASGNTTPVATTVPPTPQGGGTNDAGAPTNVIWSMGIRVVNDGTGDMEVSFDGVNVHGRLKANEIATYYRRHEGGIALRGAGGVGTPTFRVEAW